MLTYYYLYMSAFRKYYESLTVWVCVTNMNYRTVLVEPGQYVLCQWGTHCRLMYFYCCHWHRNVLLQSCDVNPIWQKISTGVDIVFQVVSVLILNKPQVFPTDSTLNTYNSIVRLLDCGCGEQKRWVYFYLYCNVHCLLRHYHSLMSSSGIFFVDFLNQQK